MADTHWYIDTIAASGGGDDGTAPADAWQSIKTGMEYNAFNAANTNKIWIRRTSSHTMVADINFVDDGYADRPILFIGWPRPVIPNTTITGADFTNGSNIVDNVAGITVKRESHLGRFITAPDGERYLLTAILYEADVDGMAGGDEFTVGSKLTNTTQTQYGKLWAFTDSLDTTGTIQYVRHPDAAWVEDNNITDADGGDAEVDAGGETAVGFLIDREYAGSTVTSTNGKFQIEADEEYTDRSADGISAGWDADAIDLPLIDGNSANFCIVSSAEEYYGLNNIAFKNGADANYGMFYSVSHGATFKGCLVSVNNSINERCVHFSSYTPLIDRCIFEGGGTFLAAQFFVYFAGGGGIIKNSALYGAGAAAIYTNGYNIFLENVNLGVERDNETYDIGSYFDVNIKGNNVKFGGGGANGYIGVYKATGQFKISIENYQKVLGDHKTFFNCGEYISTDISGETPNKKLSDTVLKIVPNVPGFEISEDNFKAFILEHEITVISGPQTFKYWIYNDMGETLNAAERDDVFLKAEYVKTYNNPQMYTMAEAFSTETSIEDAADADDWDSLSVTINPIDATKVRLKIYWSKYSAAGTFFIDPQVVIS